MRRSGVSVARALLIFVAAGAALATYAAPARAEGRPDPAGAPAGEALRGSVLVWQDAPLLAEPSEAAASIRVGALDAPRRDRVGHVVPMRVVGTRGAFVEVEPAAGPDCTWSRLATSDDIARLRLFVRRADIAPVLAKPFAKAFPDGTRLALQPGTPVLAAGDGTYAVSLRGAEVGVDVPAASVAHSYTPERAKAVAVSAEEYEIDPKAAIALGGKPIALAGWHAIAVERRGEYALATLEGRCTTAQVAVPAKAVRTSDDDETGIGLGGSGGGGVLGLRNEHYLPIATSLSVGGHTVALAAKPIWLPAAPTSKTVCVDRRVWIDAEILPPQTTDLDDKLRLCAPAAKVVHDRYRRAAAGSGTTQR